MGVNHYIDTTDVIYRTVVSLVQSFEKESEYLYDLVKGLNASSYVVSTFYATRWQTLKQTIQDMLNSTVKNGDLSFETKFGFSNSRTLKHVHQYIIHFNDTPVVIVYFNEETGHFSVR